ncbi:hypothetical protein DSL92_00490 [Billgrantia gudaonensis]|uniref:Uncharacterized protein n=1 Tax=Billgrantia gudaonensis TaxID=376427 RepID=A0A3S0NXJ7_9GAMM|nr:hypothetical protein DSL92_00490 [Halomonas gudaonensis]
MVSAFAAALWGHGSFTCWAFAASELRRHGVLLAIPHHDPLPENPGQPASLDRPLLWDTLAAAG